MAGSLTSLARVAAGVILVLFVLFVVNQTAQVVALADRVSPLLGSVVLWTLLAAYAGAGLYIWFQYVRCPSPCDRRQARTARSIPATWRPSRLA